MTQRGYFVRATSAVGSALYYVFGVYPERLFLAEASTSGERSHGKLSNDRTKSSAFFLREFKCPSHSMKTLFTAANALTLVSPVTFG